jgi:hypothetical protein
MENYLDYLIYAVLIAFAINLVLRLVNASLKAQLEERETLIKKISDLVHIVKEEKHGEMLYWFDNDDDRFLAQGRNIDEIRAHLKHRFEKHIFIYEDQALAGENYEVVPVTALQQHVKI